MLKGYMSCREVTAKLLRFLHYDLDKKTMKKMALHLRNCPICMEHYGRLQIRKRELRIKLYEIQKQIKLEHDISSYIDGEIEKSGQDLINKLVKWNMEYKKEYEEALKLKDFIQKCKSEIIKRNQPDELFEIKEEKFRIKMKERITRIFQRRHHENLICR